MKKLLVIPLIVISTSVFAQGFQFGLKAGANISNFTGGDIETKSLVGLHGGAFLNLLFGNNFMLSPEVLISSQGAKLDDADETKVKLSYLSVPVLLRYRFNGGFYLEAGPQVSFPLNANVDGQDVEDFADDLDLAFDAGLGFHSDMGLGVGARYVIGLSKLGNFNPGTTEPNVKNGVAQISVFYTFFNNNRDKD